MQLSARYKSIFELMVEVFEDRKPADNVINAYFRARRFIGSSDRRFISEHIWKIIRNRRKLEFDAKSFEPRRILIEYLRDENLDEIFCGGKYGLEELALDEQGILKYRNEETYPEDVEAETPKWLFDKINNPNLCKALSAQAPADFRINTFSREEIINKLGLEGFEFSETPYSPIGVRSNARVNLNNCIAYKEGEIDVQDEASQLACILSDVRVDDKVIDYCCGAGGKSLTISYLLKNQGKIFVHDINWGRLEAIKDRMDRLNVKNIEIIKEVEDTDYDKFIIDAPCSGTGTWRRSPDAKFRLTQNNLDELIKTQAKILSFAAKHVKKGGRIVYITCSVLKDENEKVIEEFLRAHKDFKKINIREIWEHKICQPYPHADDFCLRMSPLTTNTDGFFICLLEAACC